MTVHDPALVESIARVCHAANAEEQALTGDPSPSQPWHSVSEHVRESARAGVRAVLGGATPEQLHDAWVAHKAAAGWTHGPVKDEAARTHPCMVPFADLPEGQRRKDRVFHAIVNAMRPDGGLDDGETYGETYWNAYAACDPACASGIPLSMLGSAVQQAIEAGAQAVAARARGEVRRRIPGFPYDGRHPSACRCQFCSEDIREIREREDREELDDDTDSAIPDTEGANW